MITAALKSEVAVIGSGKEVPDRVTRFLARPSSVQPETHVRMCLPCEVRIRFFCFALYFSFALSFFLFISLFPGYLRETGFILIGLVSLRHPVFFFLNSGGFRFPPLGCFCCVVRTWHVEIEFAFLY